MTAPQKLPQISLEYDADYHQDLPHVVKFSGGRSSGLMLIALLEQGLLDASRGDVVIFNNTSAEHPATYEFVCKCKEYTEQEKCIPFFWIEYATFEDAYNGEWTRQSSFKLVHDTPCEEANLDGYHWRGEVFEELVSMMGYLPSRHTRTCTSHLKLRATYDFLAEWFAIKESTLRLGHYYDESQITDQSILQKHLKSGGKMTEGELLAKRAFVRTRPRVRPAQKFDDFSTIGSKSILESQLASESSGDLANISGVNPIEYVSLVGLRFDELRRVHRVKQRSTSGMGKPARKSPSSPSGEIICTPLADSSITKDVVSQFWDLWHWDLELPHSANLSNCVYCFMKGSKAIAHISSNMNTVNSTLRKNIRSVPQTPSDINWWANLEDKYRRVPKKRGSKTGEIDSSTVSIGFWGVDSKESYQGLRDFEIDNSQNIDELLVGSNALPCDCTD